MFQRGSDDDERARVVARLGQRDHCAQVTGELARPLRVIRVIMFEDLP
jgi:hypothetical protein